MTIWKGNVSILLLEDNPDDVELLKIALDRSDLNYTLTAVDNKADFEETFTTGYDLIISDYNLKDYDGLSAIRTVRSKFHTLPIILLSGTVGEELAVDILKEGANDFILKSNMKKIPLAISRVLHESNISREKRLFQKELVAKNLILDTIFDNFQNMTFLKEESGRYLKVNRAFCEFAELRENEILGKTDREIFPEEISKKGEEYDEYVLLTGKPTTYEIEYIRPSGKRSILEIIKTPLKDEDEITGILGECRDITRQKLLYEETLKAKFILSQAEKLTESGSFEYDKDLDVLICSANFKRMMNLNIEGEMISFRKFIQMVKEEDHDLFVEGINRALDGNKDYYSEHRFNISHDHGEDNIKHFKIMLRPDHKDDKGVRYYGTIVDTTSEHENHVYLMNKQEEERKELARELHDNLGQKMNAISMFISKICDDQKENKELQKVKELAHEAIDDLGFIISNVSVKQVEEHSLDYAISRLLRYMPEEVDINNNFSVDEERVSPFVKSQLFRVVQEALNNVTKYSRAKKLDLDIIQEGGIINLNIADDGVGFAVDEVLNGNGLQNITHRVRRSNGLINIDSDKGKGTRLTVKMPVN